MICRFKFDINAHVSEPEDGIIFCSNTYFRRPFPLTPPPPYSLFYIKETKSLTYSKEVFNFLFTKKNLINQNMFFV